MELQNNKLPNFKYISEIDYYSLVDSHNYVGIARLEGFKQFGFQEQDRVIYIQFDSDKEDLISDCIKEVINTYHSDWKTYSKEIRTNTNTEII